MTLPRWGFVLAFGLTACGGSKAPPDDADDFESERVSEEQNKNEVDPFFEGDSNRGTEKVDLQDDGEGESRDDEGGEEGEETDDEPK